MHFRTSWVSKLELGHKEPLIPRHFNANMDVYVFISLGGLLGGFGSKISLDGKIW